MRKLPLPITFRSPAVFGAHLAPTVALVLALSASPALEGQTSGFVEGSVRSPTSPGGVIGVMLQVLDSQQVVVARGFSGGEGRFLLEVAEGGPYVLRTESMGFRAGSTPPFHVQPADTLRLPGIELVPQSSDRPPPEAVAPPARSSVRARIPLHAALRRPAVSSDHRPGK